MRRRNMKAIAVGMAALLLVAAAGCGSSDSADSDDGRQEVTAGVMPILDVAPIYLGKEKGIFEDHGIDLKLTSAQGGAAIVPGVLSGEFEFGFSNVTSLIVANDKDLPIRIAAAANFSTGKTPDFFAILANGDSPIEDASDLEGKKVAINTLNNIGDTTVRETMRKADADPSKVEFVEMAFPDMPAALEKGRIDAAWAPEPFPTIMKNQGAKVIAWPLVDTAPGLMMSAYFTSEKLKDSDPELVEKFADAINESQKYSQDHPDEVRDIVTSYTEIDEDLLPDMVLPDFKTEINVKSTKKLAELALKDGLIDEKADLSTLLPASD